LRLWLVCCDAGASTGGSYRGLYRLCVSAWIVFGLASCASIIAALQDSLSSLVTRAEAKMKDKDNDATDAAAAAAETGADDQ